MSSPAGSLIKEWRSRRRFSQLDLAVQAGVSMKHVSFIETGRSRPSPEMIDHLARHLEIPLRERNRILLAAGHAPRYGDRAYALDERNELHAAVQTIIDAHTYPAIVVTADWDLVTANAAAALFFEGVPNDLLAPPVNVVRVSLDERGLAPRIVNLGEYAAHIIERIERAAAAHDPNGTLGRLLDDFGHLSRGHTVSSTDAGIVLPLVLNTPGGVLRLFSTITTFGSPRDVNLAELAIETFYPADPASRGLLSELTAG